MGYGDSGIGIQKQFRDRLANYVAAAHHNGTLAARIDAALIDEMHNALRGARNGTVLIQPEPGDIAGMEPIHILGRGDCIDDSVLVDM